MTCLAEDVGDSSGVCASVHDSASQDPVVRYSTEDDNGLRKQSRQEEASGPVVLAPSGLPPV